MKLIDMKNKVSGVKKLSERISSRLDITEKYSLIDPLSKDTTMY